MVTLALSFARFWRHLAPAYRMRFLIAPLVYFGCAIGFELLESPLYEAGRQMTFAYAVFTTCEEVGEMIGVALLMRVLLTYISDMGISLRIERPR